MAENGNPCSPSSPLTGRKVESSNLEDQPRKGLTKRETFVRGEVGGAFLFIPLMGEARGLKKFCRPPTKRRRGTVSPIEGREKRSELSIKLGVIQNTRGGDIPVDNRGDEKKGKNDISLISQSEVSHANAKERPFEKSKKGNSSHLGR